MPGAGKTMHATYQGLKAQSRPGGTIANYAVTKPRRWLHVEEDQMTPEFLRDHAERYCRPGRESQALVIVDEAHRILNSRSGWNEDQSGQARRRELLRFFSEHRHFGYDVILVAQADAMLDKQVRFLIETEVVHFRLERQTWWLRWIPFPIFAQREQSYQFRKLPGHLSLMFFPPAIGRYDTQAMRLRWGRGRDGSPPPPVRALQDVYDYVAAPVEHDAQPVQVADELTLERNASGAVDGASFEDVGDQSDFSIGKREYARLAHEARRFAHS